jgi:hypothetical protein
MEDLNTIMMILLAKWWVKGDGWKSDKIEAVVHSLKNRSFF